MKTGILSCEKYEGFQNGHRRALRKAWPPRRLHGSRAHDAGGPTGKLLLELNFEKVYRGSTGCSDQDSPFMFPHVRVPCWV